MKAWILAIAFFTPLLCEALEYRYVRIPRNLFPPERARKIGLIEDHYQGSKYQMAYLPFSASLSRSEEEVVIEMDPKDWATTLYDVDTLQEKKGIERISEPYEDFHTYSTLTKELQELASAHSKLMTLESAGKTVEGRELWVARLTNKNSTTEGKPKLLYISSMHGDEVTGKEMMIYLIRELLAKHGSDSKITQLLNHNEIFIMPSMNPDGTERHQRFNANGVDLNRNFPELSEDPASASGHAIEVRAIQELHRKHHFQVALNFHGGSLCVNIPWDSKQNTASNLFGDSELMMKLAKEYVATNIPMYNQHFANFNHGVTFGYEWYPVYGGMQDWASFFYQSTHATVEISEAKWPGASSLPSFWRENRDSLLNFLYSGSTGVHLKVTNEAGALLPVQVAISGAKRTLQYSGYVHRPSARTSEVVTLSSTGYETKEVNLKTAQFDGTYYSIILK